MLLYISPDVREKELFEISAEEGAISNERNIENKHNTTNNLFQKFNYKSETYLFKKTYQKQDYSFYCCQLKFREKKNVSQNSSFLGAHSK